MVTSRVTVTPDALAAHVVSEPGTGAPAGPGDIDTVSPEPAGGTFLWLRNKRAPMLLRTSSPCGNRIRPFLNCFMSYRSAQYP